MDLLAALCEMFLFLLKMPLWELFQNSCYTSNLPSVFIWNNFEMPITGFVCDMDRNKGSVFSSVCFSKMDCCIKSLVFEKQKLFHGSSSSSPEISTNASL